MVNTSDKPTSADGLILVVENVAKAFGRRRICRDVSLELKTGDCLAVVGPNGSGKTTFLRLLCGLLRPDRGTIFYLSGGQSFRRNSWYRFVGLVAADLALYDELTARENLRFVNKVGGWGRSETDLMSLLEDVELADRSGDLLAEFSSGMKQRMKYAAALVKSPPLLLLDEPTANLDESGIAIFHEVVKRQHAVGICILATNDPQEAELAERQIVMGH